MVVASVCSCHATPISNIMSTRADRLAPIRSVDVLPTVLRAMGIDETHRTDGRAYRLR